MRLAKLPAGERRRVLHRLNGHPVKATDIHDLTKSVHAEMRLHAAKSFARKSNSPDDGNIIIGGMDLLWDRLADNSVSLFLTDPPYAQIELYEKLAELAAAKLKPGHLCLAYSGQIYLSEVMALMGKHLDYWWTFAIQFSGSHCSIRPRHIQNCWRPIVAFAKPPVKPAPEWLSDHLVGGGRDKSHHDWGQDESEVIYVVNRLTKPGDLVVDPFCGGGTVPMVCKATGRNWLATEIDKGTALIARKRLAEAVAEGRWKSKPR